MNGNELLISMTALRQLLDESRAYLEELVPATRSGYAFERDTLIGCKLPR
jgi:hypothetical protein